jgi:hypothetical protein
MLNQYQGLSKEVTKLSQEDIWKISSLKDQTGNKTCSVWLNRELSNTFDKYSNSSLERIWSSVCCKRLVDEVKGERFAIETEHSLCPELFEAKSLKVD